MSRARLVGPMASDGMPYFPPVKRPRGELRSLPVPKILETTALQEKGKPVRLVNFHLLCGRELYLGYHDLSTALRYPTWHPEFYASTAADAAPLSVCPNCRKILERDHIRAEMPLEPIALPVEDAAPVETLAAELEPQRVAIEVQTYRVMRERGVYWDGRGIPQGGVFKVVSAKLTNGGRGHLSRMVNLGRVIKEKGGI